MVHAKRGLLAATDDADEKFKLLDEIGDIYHEKLQNPQKAIAAYLEALEVKPDDHQLLQKVLDLYTETKQWKKAVEILMQLAELETGSGKGTYYHAAHDRARRAQVSSTSDRHFNRRARCDLLQPRALDEDCRTYLKAFEAIDKILTTKKDWKAQERTYRKMIKRLPAATAPETQITGRAVARARRDLSLAPQGLPGGDRRRSRSREQLDPDDARAPRDPGRAVRAWRARLHDKAVERAHAHDRDEDPFKYDSYKALRKLYMELHQYDKTWCMCNTLAFLQEGRPRRAAVLRAVQAEGLRARQGAADRRDVGQARVHPDEDRYISAIFAAVWQAVALR